MLLPDVNVLVYAHRRDAPNHRPYLGWLEQLLNGDEAYGLSELVLSGFVRVVTHPRIFIPPSSLEEALGCVGGTPSMSHQRRPDQRPVAVGARRTSTPRSS